MFTFCGKISSWRRGLANLSKSDMKNYSTLYTNAQILSLALCNFCGHSSFYLDTSFSDGDCLLFHGFVNGHLILRIHLIKLVNATDTLKTGKHWLHSIIELTACMIIWQHSAPLHIFIACVLESDNLFNLNHRIYNIPRCVNKKSNSTSTKIHILQLR